MTNPIRAALEIQRIYGADAGEIVRVRVLGDGRKLVHFELSLHDFARAVMGTSGIPVVVYSGQRFPEATE